MRCGKVSFDADQKGPMPYNLRVSQTVTFIWGLGCAQRHCSALRSFDAGSPGSFNTVLGSVRHEAGDRACVEEFARHAAEDPLAEAAMSVGTSDQKVRTFLLRDPEQLRRT